MGELGTGDGPGWQRATRDEGIVKIRREEGGEGEGERTFTRMYSLGVIGFPLGQPIKIQAQPPPLPPPQNNPRPVYPHKNGFEFLIKRGDLSDIDKRERGGRVFWEEER